MINNKKAAVINVDILTYDDYLDAYYIQYELRIKAGVHRRRKAFYSYEDGLSDKEDSKNKELIERTRTAIKLYNAGVKRMKRR